MEKLKVCYQKHLHGFKNTLPLPQSKPMNPLRKKIKECQSDLYIFCKR